MASGNYLTNFGDAWNALTGQPLNRPVQNSTLDSFANSRGPMSRSPKTDRYYPTNELYEGIYGATPSAGDGGLTSRSVKTVPVDKYGQPIPVARGNISPSWADPSILRNNTNNWAVANAVRGATPILMAFDATGKPVYPIGSQPKPLEITVTGGNAPIKPSWVNPPKTGFKHPVAPTPEMVQAAADMAKGVPGASKRYANALADAGGQKPAGGLASLLNGNTAAPRASGGLFGLLFGGGASKPAAAPYGGRYTPQQLADREAQGQAIAQVNRQNPNPTYTVSGDNNAFMPRSVQESLRWQSGY